MLSDSLSLTDYVKGLLVMYVLLDTMSEERSSELAKIKAKYDSLIIGYEEIDPIEIATFENRIDEIKNEQSIIGKLLNMAFCHFQQRCLEIPLRKLELLQYRRTGNLSLKAKLYAASYNLYHKKCGMRKHAAFFNAVI